MTDEEYAHRVFTRPPPPPPSIAQLRVRAQYAHTRARLIMLALPASRTPYVQQTATPHADALLDTLFASVEAWP